MPNLRTLNNFIDEQLTKFKIPDTEENKKNCRAKFMRELKKLGYWNNDNPTIIIERSKTKQFTDKQLNDLYKRVESYLIKRSTLDFNLINQQKEKNQKLLDNPIPPLSYEEQEELLLFPPVEIPKNQKLEIMIEAIFNKYFELDEKLWLDDLQILDDPFHENQNNQELLTSTSYITAQLRNKNPLESYVKPRKKTS